MTTRPSSYVFIGGTSEPGGLHVHTVDVAMAVAESGHKATILCTSIDHFSAMIQHPRVEVKRIPARKKEESPLRYWRRELAPYRMSTAVLLRGKLGEGEAKDLVGIRLSCRGLLTIEHRGVDNPELTAKQLRHQGRIMNLVVRRVIAVSEEIREEALSRLSLKPSRVACCLNWVDPIFSPCSIGQKNEMRHRLGIASDELVLGYHGRLAPEKRVDHLISAFAALPPEVQRKARLLIAGEGWKRSALEKLVAECGLSDRVLFTGWHPDPSGMLAAFDLSVLPSLAEGFPLGLMEAMASGLPCLAHPMSSTCHLIDHGRNGHLANLNTTEEFTRALRLMLELDHSARVRMGNAAAETIRRHYSRERRLPAVLIALGLDDTTAVERIPIRPRSLIFVK